MSLSSNRVLRVAARIIQIAVALVLLFAAILKALDIDAFAAQITSYGIFPELSLIAAWSLIMTSTPATATNMLDTYTQICP